jgi:hypothetical protein
MPAACPPIARESRVLCLRRRRPSPEARASRFALIGLLQEGHLVGSYRSQMVRRANREEVVA